VDLSQSRNFVVNSNLASVREVLSQRVEHRMSDTSDPLLSGIVPIAPGGTMNDASGRSLEEDLIVAGEEGNQSWIPNPGINA